ncbi:hypothetical protein BC826DRAFT_1189750 [Russula brevipes]|nr:hypothetical protein BC826DRAFT_1189750 [Russula brevipes]
MSSTPIATTSLSNLDSIFTSAFRAYNKKTGKDITTHPLATELQTCHSTDAVLTVLRRKIPALGQSQNSDERPSKWLIPTVNVLYAFSATLAEGVGLAFSPAKVIFAGIGVLLLAAKDVSTSREILTDLFDRIGNFFLRLEIYTGVRPTAAMTDIIVQIMVEVLTILAVATKEVRRGRLKKYFKKLMGDTEVEDSLERLDRLTQEEARMASAELLKMTDMLSSQVKGVDTRVQEVGDHVGNKVQDVDGRVQGIGNDIANKVEDVGDKVQGVDDKVQDVGDKVQDVSGKVQGVGEKVQGVGDKMQGIDDKLDQAARNQLRDRLLQWLSPPDPSTNHNIARKASHSGTAQWFFRGGIFNQWKSNGSFLWVHGKPGSGKSVLCSSIIQDIFALRKAGRASMAYFYFDFRDIDKQNLQNLLPSLLIQLSAQSNSCCDILSRLYSAHDRGVQKPSDRAMAKCLKEMLALKAQGHTYIILDALDECPNTSGIPSPREEVLDFVNELVDLHLPNLHLCVTSRPEFDIHAVLQPLSPRAVSLHDESGQTEDILEYVTSVVHSDRSTSGKTSRASES